MTDADRLSAWALLWRGTMRLLKSYDRTAYHRLKAKLLRHRLLDPIIARDGGLSYEDWERRGKPANQAPHPPGRYKQKEPCLAHYRPHPSDLALLAAFADDEKPIRPHRPRSPVWLAALLYDLIRKTRQRGPLSRGKGRLSVHETTLSNLRDRFFPDAELATIEDWVKRGRRQARTRSDPASDRALVRLLLG